MSFTVDFSSIRTVRVHKEQFDAIDNKANVVMITCIEDGRVITFNRADSEKDKIDRLVYQYSYEPWFIRMIF